MTSDDVTIWWAVDGPTSDAGGGPPLLLIQGLGYTADLWFRVLPGLSGPRRTIRFDNRGVGRSNVPPTPWSIEDMADDALGVLDAAGVDHAHVFGVSLGGLIAQELTLPIPTGWRHSCWDARTRAAVTRCGWIRRRRRC
jgi:pimeloyl-ACP methyl ester carboxylesterase